jgi:hypothetical protein
MKQPISDRIEDLRGWLSNPPEMRRDAKGALVVLSEIAASHADLLEALETLVDEQNGPPLYRHAARWEAAMTKARAAIAKSRGNS